MSLGPERTAVVRLSAALARAGAAANDPALDAALAKAAEVARVELVEEVILQSYLFLGYPAALNAFARWRAVAEPADPPPVEGTGDPEEEDGAGVDGSGPWTAWAARGEEVCRTVYGGQYDDLRANVRRLHPDMERWMVVEGYGKVLGRPGADLATRELCIVALLAVIAAPTQLYSHLRGALNAGAGPAAVEAALEVASEVAAPAAARVARETWERVRRRRDRVPDAPSG